MLKLNVGLSKKLGLPDYGSLGASCHVEIELDQSLIAGDPDGFQERVRRTFAVCSAAVDDELDHHRGHGGSEPLDASAQRSVPTINRGNGGRRNGNGHRASQKQIGYAEQLAGEIRGLGIQRLQTLASKMYGTPLAGLSSLDASGLIDVLKDMKAGKIQLGDALNGAAA